MMMTGPSVAFVAMLFLSWTVPDGAPYRDLLADPGNAEMAVEIMGFADAETCEAFIDKIREDDSGAFLPYDGATVSRAECRPY
ncbi:hypothetical protein [Fodinicurvata sp. EGI_FJ10296]|uniref:hypothetical protein n=1 Tax=Fodinicurvata sp. EGI_FJ10296 TaxID=3231908 RepID=UPI003456755D